MTSDGEAGEQEKRGLLGDSPGSHCQSHQQMIATNIVDKVQVPATIEPGDYLISWRWVRVHNLLVPRLDVLALRALAVLRRTVSRQTRSGRTAAT